jgi:hypothetical protein
VKYIGKTPLNNGIHFINKGQECKTGPVREQYCGGAMYFICIYEDRTLKLSNLFK